MSIVAADFAVEGSGPNKDAKSALRDALRAKLKTGQPLYYSDNRIDTQTGVVSDNSSSSLSTPSNESEAIVPDDSDESDDDSDGGGGKADDNKDSINNIPIEERRLRNRLAARKCREKRKQRILNLEKICSNLEGRISTLQSEIEGLDEQKQNLSKALENHTCVHRFAPKLTPKHSSVITNVMRK